MWEFLDTLNHNLLLKYEYDIALNRFTKARRRPDAPSFCNDDNKEENVLIERNNILYIIWFVYYYVLECKTFSEASELNHLSIFADFGLLRYIDHVSTERAKLFVGYGEYKFYFTSIKDIDTIIEILYNRYNYKEQLECIARHLVQEEKMFKLSPKAGKAKSSLNMRKETIKTMIRMYNKWEKAS